jgi:cobalt-zinc-cadmium efflux system outer membrane protein
MSASTCSWRSLKGTRPRRTEFQQSSDELQTFIGYEHMSRTFDIIIGDILPPPVMSTLDDLQQRAFALDRDHKDAVDSIRVADSNVKLAYAEGTTDPTLEGEYDRSAP